MHSNAPVIHCSGLSEYTTSSALYHARFASRPGLAIRARLFFTPQPQVHFKSYAGAIRISTLPKVERFASKTAGCEFKYVTFIEPGLCVWQCVPSGLRRVVLAQGRAIASSGVEALGVGSLGRVEWRPAEHKISRSYFFHRLLPADRGSSRHAPCPGQSVLKMQVLTGRRPCTGSFRTCRFLDLPARTPCDNKISVYEGNATTNDSLGHI
jgi:hypothetical protein